MNSKSEAIRIKKCSTKGRKQVRKIFNGIKFTRGLNCSGFGSTIDGIAAYRAGSQFPRGRVSESSREPLVLHGRQTRMGNIFNPNTMRPNG